jgi:hypothetical protein
MVDGRPRFEWKNKYTIPYKKTGLRILLISDVNLPPLVYRPTKAPSGASTPPSVSVHGSILTHQSSWILTSVGIRIRFPKIMRIRICNPPTNQYQQGLPAKLIQFNKIVQVSLDFTKNLLLPMQKIDDVKRLFLPYIFRKYIFSLEELKWTRNLKHQSNILAKIKLFSQTFRVLLKGHPVPEFIDPVFTKTSPKRSFTLNRKRAFWLVFAKSGSIISGTG